MKISPVQTARATYVFVLRHRGECARILWLPLLLMFLLTAWLLPRIVALVHDDSRSTPVLVLFGILMLAGLTLLTSIMCAGLWRFVLRGIPVSTPYYLGFGNDELRLLALSGVKALLFVAWTLVAAVVTGLVALATVYKLGAVSAPALALAFVATLPALAWFGTRVGLSGPATIRAQRLSIAASWKATAHNVVRLQRVAALLMTPVSLVILLLVLVLLLLLMAWWPASASAAEFARMCAALLRWLRYLWPLALFIIYLVAMFVAALFIVARALAYQEIGPAPATPI